MNVPPGYDANADDDVHSCDDTRPSITSVNATDNADGTWTITVNVAQGTFGLSSSSVSINANGALTVTRNGNSYKATYTGTANPITTGDVTVSVTDDGYYSVSNTY